MKKTKIIIPSLGLLLLSTAASVTGTVAWFAANATVEATGMNIKATSNNQFLQIQTSAASWSETDAQTTVAVNNSPVAELLPTHVANSVATGGATFTAYSGGSTFTFIEAFSDDPTAYQAATIYSEVASGDIANYALKTDFKVRLKPNAGATTAPNLKVSDVTVTANASNEIADGLLNAVRVFVVTSTAGTVWKNGERVEGATNDIIAATVTTSDLALSVYVYFDGEDSACYTNNALTPDDYSVSFKLSL